MQWVRKVRKKLPSTWFSLLSDLTPLSIRNKQTPHRYTNGSVLAGVLCYFLCVCEYVCVATSHPSLKVCFCVVAVKWGFVYLLAHECESVCVVTGEGIHFCRIWMKVRVMTTISILSSFPPEFICLCPVHVHTCYSHDNLPQATKRLSRDILVWLSVTVKYLYLRQCVYFQWWLYAHLCAAKTIIIAFLTSDMQKYDKRDANKTCEIFFRFRACLQNMWNRCVRTFQSNETVIYFVFCSSSCLCFCELRLHSA